MIGQSSLSKQQLIYSNKHNHKEGFASDKIRMNQREMRSTTKSKGIQQIVTNQRRESIIIQLEDFDTAHSDQLHELESLRRSKEEWTFGIWWFCGFVIFLIGISIWLFIMGFIFLIAFILPMTLFCMLLFVWMCREDIRYSNKIHDKVIEINESWINMGEFEMRPKFEIQDRCCCLNYKLFSNV